MDDDEFEFQMLGQLTLLVVMYVRQRQRRRRTEQARRRRQWVRPINQRRRQQGDFHNLLQEMRLSDPASHFSYLRMSKGRFDALLQMVEPHLRRRSYFSSIRAAILPAEKLALTLRFLASGNSQISMAFSYRVGRSTVNAVLMETCQVLWDVLCGEFLKAPATPEEWRVISQDFWLKWNFPNCIGSIDGKHIVVQAPKNTGSFYYNYKGTFSLVLMAICDASYRFTFVDVGGAGRQSDGGTFASSSFGKDLADGSLRLPEPSPLPGTSAPDLPSVIVGDEAFPLRNYLMRPYPGRHLPDNSTIFNYRLSRARRVIEDAYIKYISKRLLQTTTHFLSMSIEVNLPVTALIHHVCTHV